MAGADRPLRYPIRLWVGGCAGLVKVEYLAWKSRDHPLGESLLRMYCGGVHTVRAESIAGGGGGRGMFRR